MKKIIVMLCVSIICATTVGCGVKGNLYFPEHRQAEQK